MQNRIPGFDVARAYAIFGMYIVNFTFSFGSFRDTSPAGKFSTLFVGNSTAIFIICAGMGVVLLSKNVCTNMNAYPKLRSIIIKRSWLLFALGLILYNWWPGDILHFYGGYMHIAAFLLITDKRKYIPIGLLFILIYFIIQIFIPVTTSWDLQTTRYADFWTPVGFLRNTFYNGWNSIFPWFAYFILGMYLGKLDWNNKKIRRNIFGAGLLLFALFKGLRIFIRTDYNHPKRNWFYEKYWMQLMEDYFPVNIPFMMITIGFALMVISFCIFLGNTFKSAKILDLLAKTGQMTLTHYVLHLTIGMLLFSVISKHTYTAFPTKEIPVAPIFILIYSFLFFGFSVLFSFLWNKKFKKGPLEMLMRKCTKT